ncbi:MAG TPA: PqqD family protein [Solirubrobacteraceae bacterium]|nr:PqqD family protein [Solirubrobacteraceae bacterium]
MSAELPETVSIPETVLWQEVGGEIVLLDVHEGEYRSLNDVGSEMWKALEQCRDVAAAHSRLCGLYDVDPDVLRADLAGFIARLVERQMLRIP